MELLCLLLLPTENNMFTTIEQILRYSTLLVEFLKILCQDPFLFLIVINDIGFASIVNYHSHLLQMTPTCLKKDTM